MDIKGFFAKNKLVTFMVVLAVIVGIFSYRDSKVNTNAITKVEVKKSEEQDVKELTKQIDFYIYKQNTKAIEKVSNGIESKRSVIEGDYVNQIILKSSFLPKEAKFLSAYKVDDGKKEIIKFSPDLKSLKETNEALYNSFVESVKKTIIEKFHVQEVEVQIDGDSIL